METSNHSELEQVQMTQKQLEKSLADRMANFEKRLTITPAAEVSQLREEYSDFKNIVHSIFLLLKQQIHNLSSKIDSIEMRTRRKVLLFNGIQEDSNENISNTICSILTDQFDFTDVSSHIKVCHRLGATKLDRARPVLVRFNSTDARTTVWNKKTALKGSPISISEFLTRARQEVFMATRLHFGMRRCWTMDGVICVRTPAGDRVKFTTAAELAVLTKRFPAVDADNKRVSPEENKQRTDQPRSSLLQTQPSKKTATIAAKNMTRRQMQAGKSK
ncbi:uncharacterized protein LOC132903068 [Amyelois transitella]|uniref:uncharacterized protein LOC132903068 n=1 Tax=Amyelois transitella TaxID=680683 RepID=UPI00298FB0A8|nr:uncharacterized protein LOC132903068 [Amyelois transitella]